MNIKLALLTLLLVLTSGTVLAESNYCSDEMAQVRAEKILNLSMDKIDLRLEVDKIKEEKGENSPEYKKKYAEWDMKDTLHRRAVLRCVNFSLF